MRTLQSAVSRELKSWQGSNPHGRKFGNPRVTQWLIAAGRHPVVTALIFIALFAVVAAVTCAHPPPYRGLIEFGPKDIKTFSVDTLFTGLWATQATLVALVYPIGFGFATIFLQKSHVTKASLQTYLVVSGAKLTGTCGLALLTGLTILAAVVSAVPNWTAFAWLMLGAAFLCMNILLTARFLLKTFTFATPEARRRERHSYAVSIAWPNEWRRHAAAVIASAPVRFKLVEADELTQAFRGTNPVFHASPVSFQEVVDGQPFTFKGRRLIVNIHYWLIQLAYNSWLWRVRKAPSAPSMTTGFQREGPVFVFQAWPSPREAEYGKYLAGTTKEPHLNTFEKLLLRWSIRYASLGRFDNDTTVRDCLNEIHAELTQTIREGASDDFDRQLLSLLKLFDDLLVVSYCTDEGKPSSQALTTNSDDPFTGTPALAIWLSSVSDILKFALSATSSDSYFAAKIAVVPKRLLARGRPVLSHPIRLLYLEKQYEFLRQVLDWGGELHQQPRTSAGPGADNLPEPLASRWKDVLTAALGAWESLKKDSILPYDEQWVPWGEKGRDELELLVRHLELSVTSLAMASRGGSSTAAAYLIDLLLRWKTQLALRLDQDDVYIEDPWELTIEATEQPWPEVKARHLHGRGFGSDDALMLEAWSAALTNYWRDCCAALAATVAQDFREASTEKKSLTATVLQGLLFGSISLDIPDGNASQMRPFADANEFLLTLIRQHVIDGGFRTGYRNRLDGIVKASAATNWSAYLPGRFISVRAPDSLEDVRLGQLLCLCLLADEDWIPSVREFETIFDSWSAQDTRRWELDNLFSELFDLLKLEQGESDFEVRFTQLWKILMPGKSFADAIARVSSAVASVRAALTKIRTNELAEARISQNTLAEYGKALSAKLDLDASGFPFRPNSVEVADDNPDAPTSELSFPGYPKGRLTEPRLSSGSVDEAAQLLPYVVFRMRANTIDFLTAKPDDQVLVGSKGQLLEQVEKFKKGLEAGHGVIVLVPSLGEPHWLGQLRPSSSTSVADSSAAFLERKAGYRHEPNYVGHIQGAAVYTGMVKSGSLYLLSSHALTNASLHRQVGGTVSVTADATAEEPTLCVLTARWKLRVTRSPEPVLQLLYDSSENAPGQKRSPSARRRRNSR